ncbi:carbohydrate kinase family protein [Candidatus Uhrbacteria bacterium]|nr:carbohydrate kinase family protein [Candidatus Uhrbacteria bacterium]
MSGVLCHKVWGLGNKLCYDNTIMFDLIAIGDSTLDVFLHINEATVSCQLNKTQCLLCLEYAEKIPVESVLKVPAAGNASNAAVGGSRLGLKTAIVSIVGGDETGKEIIACWKQEGVARAYVQIDRQHETNYSTVLNFHGERTILVYHQPRTYRLPKIDGAKWIYYTSIGKKHEILERQLLTHLKHYPKTRLMFNPGAHQLHRGLNKLKPVIARSSLFIVNKEEAMRLLEDGERPIPNMLMNFHHLGAGIVVITDGSKGAYATDGKQIWSCPIFPGPMVERTGAGDSFSTAFLYGLSRDWSIPDCLRAGTANAWSVVQKIGPQTGLLNTTGLNKVLKKFSKIKARLEPNH